MDEAGAVAAVRLRSMAELAAVDDPEALQRHLLGSSYEHAELNAFDAVVAFQRAHRAERDGANLTAVLLCTDPRWRRTTKPLIRAIVDTGILSNEALDELAGWFLAGEEVWVHVPVPVIDEHHVGRHGESVPLWRQVRPPLVGWAAAHAVHRDGARAVEVLLADLDHRTAAHGGAVLKGMIEVLDAVPGVVGERVLHRALSWPEAATRTAAIRHLHAHGHVDRAIRLARADNARMVRKLGDRLQGQLALSRDQGASPVADPAVGPTDSHAPPATPLTLFSG